MQKSKQNIKHVHADKYITENCYLSTHVEKKYFRHKKEKKQEPSQEKIAQIPKKITVKESNISLDNGPTCKPTNVTKKSTWRERSSKKGCHIDIIIKVYCCIF